MQDKPGIKCWVGGSAAYVGVVTAWPHLAYLLRWPSRLGPKGLLMYVGYRTLSAVGLKYYVVPVMQQFVGRQQQQREELAAILGREPTDAEFIAHLHPNDG